MLIAKSKKFAKQHKKLPLKTQVQFAQRLRLYTEDETHYLLNVHSLQGKYKGLWSFNVSSDIRVIFDISEKNVLILIAVGSHSELYN